MTLDVEHAVLRLVVALAWRGHAVTIALDTLPRFVFMLPSVL